MFVSVITPTYNRASKLRRVYESITSQTLQKVEGNYIFEWIVVDDGSDDNTREIVAKWREEADFPIVYLYQENSGKAKAIARGIEIVRGSWTLLADSDDRFVEKTFEVFYETIQSFSDEELKKCGGIGVLCVDQYGRRVGCDYPEEKRLVPVKRAVLEWKNIGLNETWALLKTDNLKHVFLNLPDEAKKLKFIPESFFWDRIAFELDTYSYMLNIPLRIYYRNEGDNISCNIREKYPDGFLFESKWFVKHYWQNVWSCPELYFKHILKVGYYLWKKMWI